MDALEFLKERKRMCNSFVPSCDGCPLEDKVCTITDNLSDEVYKKNIDIVEQWSKENPIKTRQSEFLKMFPEALTADDGVLDICPMSLCESYRDEYRACSNLEIPCDECARKFWMQEVE